MTLYFIYVPNIRIVRRLITEILKITPSFHNISPCFRRNGAMALTEVRIH